MSSNAGNYPTVHIEKSFLNLVKSIGNCKCNLIQVDSTIIRKYFLCVNVGYVRRFYLFWLVAISFVVDVLNSFMQVFHWDVNGIPGISCQTILFLLILWGVSRGLFVVSFRFACFVILPQDGSGALQLLRYRSTYIMLEFYISFLLVNQKRKNNFLCRNLMFV